MPQEKPIERIIGIVGALKECETRDQVEDIFSKFAVSDLAAKTRYLEECMGNPETFFSGGVKDAESEYLTLRSMFLTGEWKLNEYYNRLGNP